MKTLFVILAALVPFLAQASCGSISYSIKTGSMGWSYGYPSTNEAGSESLRQCKREAAPDHETCFEAAWECDQCVVVAYNKTNKSIWGWGSSTDLDTAISVAKSNCSGSCDYRWVCN